MNFNSITDLKLNGFAGFKTMEELFEDDACIPDIKGIYLVLHVGETPKFLIEGYGPVLYKKKINPNVSIDELEANWIKETLVIYIGKAGGENLKATLKKRLKTYFSFGQGKDARHYGGRYVWQLKNAKTLIVCWKTDLIEEPSKTEQNLIQEFKNQYRQRPFANLKD